MNDLLITRTIKLKHPSDEGTTHVEVRDFGASPRSPIPVPILIQFAPAGSEPGRAIGLRWSEWDEVRDHIEHCANISRPDPVSTTLPYVACGETPGNAAGPCVLVDGHRDGVEPENDGYDHVSMTGYRW